MSIFTQNPYYCARAVQHVRNVITADRKGDTGKALSFFKEHGGIRFFVQAGDGTELPRDIVDALNINIEPPPPPALGNGRYQKAGATPPSILNKKERDRQRRLRLKEQREASVASPPAAPKAEESTSCTQNDSSLDERSRSRNTSEVPSRQPDGEKAGKGRRSGGKALAKEAHSAPSTSIQDTLSSDKKSETKSGRSCTSKRGAKKADK